MVWKRIKQGSQAGCFSVANKKEAECGPISVALAVKLCFSAEEEKAVFEKLVDVRRDLVDSLKRNDLVDFESKKDYIVGRKVVLFTINLT